MRYTVIDFTMERKMSMNALYCLNTLPLRDDALFARYLAQTSPMRREKIEQVRRGKALSLGAAIALDCGLEVYGLREKDMTYGFGSNGKPYFTTAPSIRFSLSHSGSLVVAAFSDEEVGCDVQEITNCDITAIARRFFHPAEWAYLSGIPSEDARRVAFFRLWAMKESYLKQTGQGLSLPLQAFMITIRNNEAHIIQSVDDLPLYLQEFSPAPGYTCAVCSPERWSDVACRTISL